MSVVIAQRLRALSRKTVQVAEHASDSDNKRKLAKIAQELRQIAEQLERDATD